eukprot:4035868-Pyramimonas_sp.AAC.1
MSLSTRSIKKSEVDKAALFATRALWLDRNEGSISSWQKRGHAAAPALPGMCLTMKRGNMMRRNRGR